MTQAFNIQIPVLIIVIALSYLWGLFQGVSIAQGKQLKSIEKRYTKPEQKPEQKPNNQKGK